MSDNDDTAPALSEWLDTTSSFLPTIHGFAEASELLNDARLQVGYQSLFAEGTSQGRACEAGKRSLLNLNGEEHKRLRSAVATQFRPRSVDRIRSFARTTAEQLIHDQPISQPFDFMTQFAKPYIERTTGEYIGFPLSDLDSLTGVLDQMKHAVADLPNRATDFDASCTALLDYASDALLARRGNPSDDVLGYLARLVESESIDELFAANLVATLLSAGLEPTIFQMGLMIEELSKLPEVWDKVAADNAQGPLVLEELLRFRSTNQSVIRSVDSDLAQYDVNFEEGSRVLINIAAANHDCRRFAKADTFDVNANQGSHLAFGFGPHHCLGAPLVRVQLQEAMVALVNRRHCPQLIDVVAKTGMGLIGPQKLIIEMQHRERG